MGITLKKKIRVEYAVGPRGFSRWVQPSPQKYILSCCDCGLVHEMQFRAPIDSKGKPRVQFRARRAKRYTAQERKRREIDFRP
jgi:Zn-finger protein